MSTSAHLAFDLGASSGRAVLGVLSGDPLRLDVTEVHRFEHQPCPTPVGPVWDTTGIWLNLLHGLGEAVAACRARNVTLVSVGVDTWGVDWALVGHSGELLGLPHCYRDPQNEAACDRVLEALGGFENLFRRTGIQRLPFNTLFQIAARHAAEPALFDIGARLLFMPDLLHFWLSGRMATERTIASTGALLDVTTGEWDLALLRQLNLPTHMLGRLVDPGDTIGELNADVAAATGAPAGVQVVVPASHDTASAIAAVPVRDAKRATWAYLSSGTWSLLGVELDAPNTSEAACLVPFTNERGVDGTVRFLKNIAGLWLVQELQREFRTGGDDYDFVELTRLAAHSTPLQTLVDPNDTRFASPGEMAAKLRGYARETGQPEPTSAGQLVRCVLDSLAMCYRSTVDQLEHVLGHSIEVLHVVGGGTKNDLLNQLTADALGCEIVTGPVECTAIGNLLVQARGSGVLRDLQHLRQVVADSFDLQRYEPRVGPGEQQRHQDRFARMASP